jgi:hypothetical protein
MSLYNISPYNTSLYNISLYNTSLYNMSPYNISPYNISLYNISPYNISPYNISPYNISLCNISLYNISLYRKVQPGYGANPDAFFYCLPEIVSPGVKRTDPEVDQLHLESGLRMTGAITPLTLRLHDVKRVTIF